MSIAQPELYFDEALLPLDEEQVEKARMNLMKFGASDLNDMLGL